MSRKSLQAAFQYSKDLPTFSSLPEAEKALLDLKDSTLEVFLDENGIALGLDFSPESLKSLEQWYFEYTYPNNALGNYSLAHAIGFYFGEVFCRSAGFSWIVEKCVFIKDRYEIGVNRNLCTIMLTKGRTPPVDGNKRRQSLWREYKKLAS
jgi:hypothetical protein